MEEARGVAEAPAGEEGRHREQAPLAQQGAELADHHAEGDEVDDGEGASKHQPRQPVLRGVEPADGATVPGAGRASVPRLVGQGWRRQEKAAGGRGPAEQASAAMMTAAPVYAVRSPPGNDTPAGCTRPVR